MGQEQQLVLQSLATIKAIRSVITDNSDEQELVEKLILKGLDDIELNLRSIDSSSSKSVVQTIDNVRSTAEVVQRLMEGVSELIQWFLNQ